MKNYCQFGSISEDLATGFFKPILMSTFIMFLVFFVEPNYSDKYPFFKISVRYFSVSSKAAHRCVKTKRL